MKCGVKFCGGCNPHYQRGDAYREIKDQLTDIDFVLANEDECFDNLLVIGGCTSCCASYKQYDVAGKIIKMWDESHIEGIKEKLSQLKCDPDK